MTYVPINGVPLKLTGRALLLRLEDDDREVWVPLSVIDEEDLADLACGDEVIEINVIQWFFDREI